MIHRAAGGTHSRIKWLWLVAEDPGASNKTPDHAWNPAVPSPHPKTPRSQVANLAENGAKSGTQEWSRVWCAATEDPTHQQKWHGSVPRVSGHAGKPVPTCVLPSWPTQPPSRAMGKVNFRDGQPPISATEPVRHDTLCGQRNPQSYQMAVAGSGGSWGIQQDP